MTWELDYYAENGINECARNHAYHIAKGKYDLTTATSAIDKKYADLTASADALYLAQCFVDAIEKFKTALIQEVA